MNLKNDIYLGDCLLKLREIADNSADLIVTSLPYAESQRKNIYGGISTDRYVKWFLPITKERNEEFQKLYLKILNKLTKEFIDGFCFKDDLINWEKLVKFNSGSIQCQK